MKKNTEKIAIILIIVILIFMIGITGIYISQKGLKESTNKENTDKINNNLNKENADKIENNNSNKENTDFGDKVTNDFALSLFTKVNNKVQYGVYIYENGEYSTLDIDASIYKLPDNLIDYSNSIMFRVTYSKKNHKVYDVKVIDKLTGKIVSDLSENNLRKLYDIEYGKKVVNKLWTDTIKLSSLKENEIYKYTATTTTDNPPKIINDIKNNCIVYIKDKDDDKYEQEFYIYNNISGNSTTFSSNEFKKGDTYTIMYKKATEAELLKLIDKNDIIFLSKQLNSDEVSYSFEDYIYNDTKNNIILEVKDTAFGQEKISTVTIKAGQLYAFDWKIDSVVIKK